MVYRSFQQQARQGLGAGVQGTGKVVQPGQILAEEDLQFQFQPPPDSPSTLGRIGGAIAAVDKPISERLGFQIPEMRGPIDEIGNFILREGTRPTNLLFAIPGAGWGAKGILGAGRAASKAGQLARFGGRTPTLGRAVERVAQPVARFGVGATEPFGTFAGRLPYKLGMEAGGNILAAGLARSAMDELPEDAHWSVKLGTGLGTALLGGGIAARTGAYLPTKFPGLVDQRKLGQVWGARQLAARAGLPVPFQSVAEQESVLRNLSDDLLREGYRFELDTWGFPTLDSSRVKQNVLEPVDRLGSIFEDPALRSPFLSGVDAPAGRAGELDRYERLKVQANNAVERSQKNLNTFLEESRDAPDNIYNRITTELDEADEINDPFYENRLSPGANQARAINEILSAAEGGDAEAVAWVDGMKRSLIEAGEPEITAETFLKDFVEAQRFLKDFDDLELGIVKPESAPEFKVTNLAGKSVSIWDKSIVSNLTDPKIKKQVTKVITDNPDQFDVRRTLSEGLKNRAYYPNRSFSDIEVDIDDTLIGRVDYGRTDDAGGDLRSEALFGDGIENVPGNPVSGKYWMDAFGKLADSFPRGARFEPESFFSIFVHPEDVSRLTHGAPEALEPIRKSPSKSFFDAQGNVQRVYKETSRTGSPRFASLDAYNPKDRGKLMSIGRKITEHSRSVPKKDRDIYTLFAGLVSRIGAGKSELLAELIERDIKAYDDLPDIAQTRLDRAWDIDKLSIPDQEGLITSGFIPRESFTRPTGKEYKENLRQKLQAEQFLKEKELPDPDLGFAARQQALRQTLEEDVGIRTAEAEQAGNIYNGFVGRVPRPTDEGRWLQSEEGGIALRISNDGHLDDLRILEPEVLVDGPEAFAARQLEKQQLVEEGEIKPSQALPDDRWGITTRGIAGHSIIDAIENYGLKTAAVLDGGPMSAFFQEAGFQEIGRIPFRNAGVRPDFDTDMFGTPDVIMMAYTGAARKGRVLDSGRIVGGAAQKFGEYGGYEGTRNRFENISEAQQVAGNISDLSEKYGGKRLRDLYNDPEAAEELGRLSAEVGPTFDELETVRLTDWTFGPADDESFQGVLRQEFTAPVPEAKPRLSQDMQTFIARNRGAVRQSGAQKNRIVTLSKIEKDPRNKSQFRKVPYNYVLDTDSGNLVSEDLWIELGEQLNEWGRFMGRDMRTADKALAIESQRALNQWEDRKSVV